MLPENFTHSIQTSDGTHIDCHDPERVKDPGLAKSEPLRFSGEFNLPRCRQQRNSINPASHQKSALNKLGHWFGQPFAGDRGGILVLPTGAGKTFTASYFLCRLPLSRGYKVLWLAHTHHLLEQAFFGLESVVGLISEPAQSLRVRVVSGVPGHSPRYKISASDNVVIATLQTISQAFKANLQQLNEFIESAGEKLFVVFDEAHHSPAPSYRNLINELRKRCPQLFLLGLTATPRYSEGTKQGWLGKLFPQDILYEVTAHTLMAERILAWPRFEEAQTTFEPSFPNEREYQKWVDTYQDIPEGIITELAKNQARNDYIVGYYAQKKEKYGKTIIFADRWYQCDYMRQSLLKRGIWADVVYSHADANPGSVEARNRRTADENAKVLREFKERKDGVLINVRMLTEGTDVPDVQTVFLTRQTTSRILVNQMVGRALRGPKFRGTEEAFIVCFIDNWKQKINWAGYDELISGPAAEKPLLPSKRPPLHLISIDLVRRLAQQMDSGETVAAGPFKTLLPIGWYQVEFVALVEGSEETLPVRKLVVVFDGEKASFEEFLSVISRGNLDAFSDEAVRVDEVQDRVESWKKVYFNGFDERIGNDVGSDLFDLARHVAQNSRLPTYFSFDARDQHDLDTIAREHVNKDIGPIRVDSALRSEYAREDRYWSVLYFKYDLFKSQYDSCVNRIITESQPRDRSKAEVPNGFEGDKIEDHEPSKELKEQVKRKDNFRCLCCGCVVRRRLQVDHIIPWSLGGKNILENLQTLCKECNQEKGIDVINFRFHGTPLTVPPERMHNSDYFPSGENAKRPDQWEMFLRCTINFFFRCGAVDTVEIGARGKKFKQWQVKLYPGNNPAWLEAHKTELIQRIRDGRASAGFDAAPEEIVFSN